MTDRELKAFLTKLADVIHEHTASAIAPLLERIERVEVALVDQGQSDRVLADAASILQRHLGHG